MPIEFTCPHCESLLRVDDANAGKRARCPHCHLINRIPGSRPDVADPEPPVSQQFFIDSVSGQTFGPVRKPELDQWVQEGRVSAACKIRATGDRGGQPASVYYPDLFPADPGSELPVRPSSSGDDAGLEAKTSLGAVNQVQDKKLTEPSNPYASPTPVKQTPISITTDGLTPVQAELGMIFRHSWDVFVQNIGLLLGVGVVCGCMQLLINVVDAASQDAFGVGLVLAMATLLVLNLIQIYLLIGQTRISLKVVRGEPAEFTDLFGGGDKFLSVIGFCLLIVIPLILAFLLLIIPGIFLVLFFWPCYTLIVDNKTSVFDSFGIAAKIGERNLLNSFVLGLASFGIAALGLLLCFVGYFFANAFISVLWATAYLMMSSQIALPVSQSR